MSKKNKIMCLVSTENGDMVGEIVNQYEEVGGPDDGAIFAVISLENGQLITVNIQEYIEE
jgi:hypothetical protein